MKVNKITPEEFGKAVGKAGKRGPREGKYIGHIRGLKEGECLKFEFSDMKEFGRARNGICIACRRAGDEFHYTSCISKKTIYVKRGE